MAIKYNEPVFTIGREPLVAGTIVVRNNLRLRKQRERRRHWNKLIARFRRSSGVSRGRAVSATQLRTPVLRW
jgi:hypothetical protein